MQRRKFIKQSLAASGIGAIAATCRPANRVVPGKIIGASSQVGHLLRGNQTFPISGKLEVPILIIGAGVSGLSAARWLSDQYDYHDYLLLDLEEEVGGNARSGKNSISSYPWGAHYVPIPNNNCTEYLSFLQQAGVIERFDDRGLPFYNEEMLCNDPQERLYINGRWQEGLIPHFSIDQNGKEQIARFLQQMESFRNAIGNDGKEAFAIPVAESSKDEQFSQLDTITMGQWMHEHGYNHESLLWYVNYCTCDDFGTTIKEVSAWAGIHYFAGRKGKAINAHHSDVITWPQGNGYLVTSLKQSVKGSTATGKLAMHLEKRQDKWEVQVFDATSKSMQIVEAANVILATPQFVNTRLLPSESYNKHVREHYRYSPWMVANITVNNLKERNGEPPGWDNVLYQSNSLGYVDATHQLVDQVKQKRNLTYYLPLPAEARKEAHIRTHAEWCRIIIDDLKIVHEDIETAVENIDIMIWGHAMIQPLPGIIHGNIKDHTREMMGGLHLAHTDMSGISIFEEAFYQGIQAAKAVMQKA